MGRIVLEIPPELVEALRVPPDEKPARLHRELAVRLYQKGLLSFGKARELAGLSKWEFHWLLGEEGIVRRYDSEELEVDLRTLGEWRMPEKRSVAEAAATYGTAIADLERPVILEQEGQPLAVIISFEEYQKLRALVADDEQRRQKGWASLEALLGEIHQRPTTLSGEQIEAEIGAARTEVKRSRRARRRSH